MTETVHFFTHHAPIHSNVLFPMQQRKLVQESGKVGVPYNICFLECEVSTFISTFPCSKES
ncbi:hypothetical protein BS78_03G361200 [Paspalum vaginatum]|nr:hypothetical protein BS78_03G361200 [Paspalum vaginatum]